MGALKALPMGRNWSYALADGFTLLRNVASVEPRMDGWWLTQPERTTVRVEPEVALVLLIGLRCKQLEARNPLKLPCGPAYWTDFRGTEREVRCGSWHGGETSLCEGCLARAERDYPQGWRGYPGDTCRHRVYVGGSGRDLMCARCEDGD